MKWLAICLAVRTPWLKLSNMDTNLELKYCCPTCRGELSHDLDSYTCDTCGKRFPILHGIVDFRIRSDRYLTLEKEREKAKRLFEYGRNHNFKEMLSYYYEITDDVPPKLAKLYQVYIENSPQDARTALESLECNSDDRLLDIGCGAGGLLVAASTFVREVVGVDIALRWLVICKKRLEELDLKGTLVCADAENLPFETGRFTKIAGRDLIEHVYNVRAVLNKAYSQLSPNGKLFLTASNRYCLGPHPTTRVWGIGYFPKSIRTKLLLLLNGVDSLRFTNLISPKQIRRYCLEAGFKVKALLPKQLNIQDISVYPIKDRILIGGYQFLSRLPLLKWPLLAFGPAFELIVEKKGEDCCKASN